MYVKLASWHRVRPLSQVGELVNTLCGRVAEVKTMRDDFPENEKTCESCLRIARKERP
jgi:hypothetical protein